MSAITSYTTFVSYFRKLAQQNTQLAGSFYVGDSWRIISAQRSTITYPALWLEYPIKVHDLENDQETLLTDIGFAFSIAGGQPVDGWAEQDARLNECERILGQTIARLKRDSDANLFDLILPMQAEVLATVMADDLYGWRAEGRLKVRSWTECYHPEDWTGIASEGDTDPGGAANIEPGGTFTIPQGHLLDKLVIHSGTTQAVSVGTALGGTQVIENQNIVANDYLVHTEDIYAPNAPRTLYFTSADPISIRYRMVNFFP